MARYQNPQGDRRDMLSPLRVDHFPATFGEIRTRRTTTIITAGCLGPHSPSLCIGDIQHLQFQEGDEGPYCLVPEERQERRFDKPTGESTTRARATEDLLADIVANEERLGNAADAARWARERSVNCFAIFNRCRELKIKCTERVPVVQKGWVGQSKGLDDIVKERGLLPPDQRQHEPETYRQLLRTCPDFKGSIHIGEDDPSIFVPRLMDMPTDARTDLVQRMYIGHDAEVYDATEDVLRQVWNEGLRRMPKAEGESLMVSSFSSRGFGIVALPNQRIEPAEPIEREWHRGHQFLRQIRESVDAILDRVRWIRRVAHGLGHPRSNHDGLEV